MQLPEYLSCPIDEHTCIRKNCVEHPEFPECQQQAYVLAAEIYEHSQEGETSATKAIQTSFNRIVEKAHELEINPLLFFYRITDVAMGNFDVDLDHPNPDSDA